MSRHRRRSAGPGYAGDDSAHQGEQGVLSHVLAMLRAAAPGRINSALMTSSPTQLSDRVTTTAMAQLKTASRRPV